MPFIFTWQELYTGRQQLYINAARTTREANNYTDAVRTTARAGGSSRIRDSKATSIA